MKHSIIIPHHGRDLHLRECLSQLRRVIGYDDDREILVCGTVSFLHRAFHVRHVEGPTQIHGEFNKCVLVNLGIEAARGAVLSFLDADALVGPRWPESLAILEDLAVTKVCYRVRYLPASPTSDHFHALVRDAFANYESVSPNCQKVYRKAFEARVRPEYGEQHAGEPLFGNSHFSITRRALGEVRMDERFSGGCMEDIAFNRAIWRAHGAHYLAVMPDDPLENILCLQHPREQPGWRTSEIVTRNTDLYWKT